MKVVLFCGGYGMRMRDGVQDLPKPMVMVGQRPLIWHVMRYYAHFGHRDFVLAMGYGAHHITEYFLNYDETRSNDFVIDGGQVRHLSTDIADWRITVVHTGLDTPIGERLRRVAVHLDHEEMFLANYADVLTDAPLAEVISRFTATRSLVSLLAVPPQAVFHVVDIGVDRSVTDIRSVGQERFRENGGYFVMRREILDHLRPGEDLVADTLTRLAHAGHVTAYPYDGFWMPADTVKERVVLHQLSESGCAPWELWRNTNPDFGAVAQRHIAAPPQGSALSRR